VELRIADEIANQTAAETVVHWSGSADANRVVRWPLINPGPQLTLVRIRSRVGEIDGQHARHVLERTDRSRGLHNQLSGTIFDERGTVTL
jgi:hypothetical protein